MNHITNDNLTPILNELKQALQSQDEVNAKLSEMQSQTTLNNVNQLQLSNIIQCYQNGLDVFQLEKKYSFFYRLIEEGLRELDNVLAQIQSKFEIKAEPNLSSEVDTLSTFTNRHVPIASGTQVAAKVRMERSQEWILATVLHFDPKTNLYGWLIRYEVQDLEADENGHSTYSVSPAQIVQLPATGDEVPEYAAGASVLALYPGTTCLYRASVVRPPSKIKDKRFCDCYLVRFEDDEKDDPYVKKEMVIDCPAIN